jgi:TonB family protein
MTDRKPCIRCQRSIDEYARTCPFCNWDQAEPLPSPEDLPAAPLYVPPRESRLQGKILGAVAFVALLIIAFVVGTLIHGFEPSEVKAATGKNSIPQVATPPPLRSNVTLVPVTGSEAPDSIEAPITSAPPQAPGQQPNDATALPAYQYAVAAARVKAEREASKKALIDPRSITAPAYQQSERTSEPKRDRTSSAERTEAYLESKPLPHIAVDHDITAHLNLTVSPEGRVTNIDSSESIPDMPKVIAAVQNWRFRPATENGTPVTAKVAVDITFRANE